MTLMSSSPHTPNAAHAPVLAFLQRQITSEQRLYAIVDAAQNSQAILSILKSPPRHTLIANLFEGERAEELASVAPYLIEFTQPDHPLLNKLIQQGWQHHWAIYFSYPNGFDNAVNKLRANLSIKDKHGAGLFRFYDPRVFNLYIPSFDAKQLRAFFGAISHYWVPEAMPDDSPQYSGSEAKPYHGILDYQCIEQTLQVQTIKLDSNQPQPTDRTGYLTHGSP